MPSNQHLIPFGPLRNSELLSNHWLHHRLNLEPEYPAFRDQALSALRSLEQLWKTESPHLPNYGEHQLEHAFIQPVLHQLGWRLYYQPPLQGRTPDYALFLDRPRHDAAVQLGRTDPAFWSGQPPSAYCALGLADREILAALTI